MPEQTETFNEDIQREFSYTTRQTIIDPIGVTGSRRVFSAQNKAIEQLDEILRATPRTKKTEQNIIAITEEIKKLKSLKLVVIPDEHNQKKSYYSIAVSAEGVTEKLYLIDQEQLISKLEALGRAKTFEEVDSNKLKQNAILKYPKKGMDTEVQREEIGLRIARLLGFSNVTNSTMVSHDTGEGQLHPCLFVPFGQMDLLTKSIENTSTLEGRLKRESMREAEDFGKYSAFFMLCGDPDFIGKNGQNKGLTRDTNPKSLYIFDQVFMKDTNFGLNRSFDIVPKSIASNMPNFISKHFMGRNKSVINDSSYEEKVKGALHVLKMQSDIRKLFQQIAKANQGKTFTRKEAAIAHKLQRDATACLTSFNSRIKNIKKLFPTIKINNKVISIDSLLKNEEKVALLNKAMLFNQLMNNPKLFDDSGKPYRAPFFCNPRIEVKQISFEPNDIVKITFGGFFSSRISARKQALLEQQGFSVSPDRKSATIPSASLLALNEQSFFKEQKAEIDIHHEYLDKNKLLMLAATYHEKSGPIVAILEKIKKDPHKDQALLEGLEHLDQLNIKNKGFIQHIKQCLLYEAAKVIIDKNPGNKVNLRSSFTESIAEGTFEDNIKQKLSGMIHRRSTSEVFKSDFKAIAPEPSIEGPAETVAPPKPGLIN